MAGQGRKPKPTALKIVSGNPGKRPINKKEPQPVAYLDAPPDYLDDLQKAIWSEGIAAAPARMLSTMDAGVYGALVVALATHRRATEQLNLSLANGADYNLMDETASGTMTPNVFIRVINQQADLIKKLSSEIGFTPSSRTRLQVDTGPASDNDFAGF